MVASSAATIPASWVFVVAGSPFTGRVPLPQRTRIARWGRCAAGTRQALSPAAVEPGWVWGQLGACGRKKQCDPKASSIGLGERWFPAGAPAARRLVRG